MFLSLFLKKITYSSLRNGCFPVELKAEKVTPIFNKSDDLDKMNFRPVSVLPHLSKVFKRIMYIQIQRFMESKLSKLPTGFRKSHSSQHSIDDVLEKCKNTLNKGDFVCVMLLNL